MKIVDRFLSWLAPRIPRLKRATETSERRASLLREELNEQRAQTVAFSELAQELSLMKSAAEERLMMVRELRTAEAFCRMPDKECRELVREKYGKEADAEGFTEKVFKERLWELELALEDRGWVRETTLAALEFSRYGVQQLIRICRIYGIKNPIIKRIAEICELYVFGRGFEIRSDDPDTNKAIQQFLHDNDAEMGHNGLALKEKDIQTDGALYFGLETDQKGKVRVIMIDPLEIMDLATDPDDTAKPLYFKRQWNRNQFDTASGRTRSVPQHCWYPSLELVHDIADGKATKGPGEIGSYPVNWDMPVLRDKVGAPAKWRWGIPPVYAAVDWARAYKDALEDYATVRRVFARFALMIETKGGPGAIAAYNALFSTTFADNQGQQIERNPPPVTGATHTSGPGTKIEAFKSAGSQSNPEELRRLLLMSCASAGMPETFFGDASTGSLATAVSLDRPTELKFTAIQRRWRHTIKRIIRYMLMVGEQTPGSSMREAKLNGATKDPHISIEFPNVVEHEMLPMIQAIAEIATCGGRNGIPAGIVDRRLMAELFLKEVGYQDAEKRLDKTYGKNYDPAADVTDQRSQPAPQSITVPLGKALTDLSKPPPLPPPPPPPPPPAPPEPKPGEPTPATPVPVKTPAPAAPQKSPGKPAPKNAATKEALLVLADALRSRATQD